MPTSSPLRPPDRVNLATLICERDVAMASTTLPRLQSLCRDGGTFTIFEDGSLTERSAELVLSKLSGARLIRRSELNQTVAEHLRSRPHSRDYWQNHPLALKLLGIPLALKFDFFYFDSDILFFKPFLLQPLHIKSRERFIFMQDIADGYSGRSVDLKFRHGLRLLSRLNAGVMAIPEKGYDPDFIEWFLSVPHFRNFPFLLEQTCWSVMPRDVSVDYIDPRLVWCADDHRLPDADTVAAHYIQHTKRRLDSDAVKFPARHELEPVTLTSVAAPWLNVWRMIRNFSARQTGK